MSTAEEAVVEEAYESRSSEGLSLTVGSRVEVLDRSDAFWWLGRDPVTGKTGLFPGKRVKLIGAAHSPPPSASSPRSIGGADGSVLALYSFEATGPDELSFVAGDCITVLARSKSGWWKGRLGDREGIFPANRTNASAKSGSKTTARPQTADALQVLADAELIQAKKKKKKKKSASTVLAPALAASSSRISAVEDEGLSFREEIAIEPVKSSLASEKTPEKATPPPSPVPRLAAAESERHENGNVGGANATSADVSSGRSPRRSPRPVRMVEGLISKLKSVTKSQDRGGAVAKGEELDIEHPFEQGSPQVVAAAPEADEPNHFQLLESDVGGLAHMSAQAPASVDPEASRRKRHGYILLELIETEEDYVKDMEMIVELFLVPLRINKVLSKQEADDVFLNLPHLVSVNQKLLDRLREEGARSQKDQRVGALFQEFFSSGAIREYTQYASQSVASGHTLLSLSKSNVQWNKFLEDTYRNPLLRDLRLDTYLIKPVQRVCRYPLLLNELRLATPAEDPDHVALGQAVESLGSVIKRINELRGESERLHHVVQLENSVRGLPPDLKMVSPGRTFVREAILEKVQKRRREQLTVWCFSDCLIYGKLQGKVHHFKGVVFFNSALLQDVADNPSKDIEHAFEMISFPSKESLLFCCPSRIQKQDWWNELSAIIERNLAEGAEKHKKERAVIRSSLESKAAGLISNDMLLQPASPVGQKAKEAVAPSMTMSAVPSSTPPPLIADNSQAGVSWDSIISQGPRKKTPGSSGIMQAKGSVRVKGADLSARVVRLRDEMGDPKNGLEMSNVAGDDESHVFSGRAAIDWTMKRFKLDESGRGSAMELMVGLLRSGVIAPVLGTPSDDFICSYTAYYAFVGSDL